MGFVISQNIQIFFIYILISSIEKSDTQVKPLFIRGWRINAKVPKIFDHIPSSQVITWLHIKKKHFKISFYGSSLSSLIFPLNYMNMTNIICPTKQIIQYNNLLSNKLSAIDFLEKTRRLAFNVGRDII